MNNYLEFKRRLLIEESKNVCDLTSDRRTVIRMLIDSSSSMYKYEEDIVKGLELFRDRVKNFQNSKEILVGKTLFNNSSYTDGYKSIEDFQINYNTYGGTALYDAIIEAKEGLTNEQNNGYIDILKQNGCRTKGILIIISDGLDENSIHKKEDAKDAIRYLIGNEIGVGFFVFAKSEIARLALELGISYDNIRILREVDQASIIRMFELVIRSVNYTTFRANRHIKDGKIINNGGLFDNWLIIS